MRNLTILSTIALFAACAGTEGTEVVDDVNDVTGTISLEWLPEFSTPSAGEGLDQEELAELTDAFLEANGKLLEGVETLEVKESVIDEQGVGHLHFVQTEGEVPVWGGELIVHLDSNGAVYRYTDTLVRGLEINAQPTFGSDEAIAAAAALQHPSSKDEEAPTAELLVVRHDGADHLVWKVTHYIATPPSSISMPVVFINAHDLSVVLELEGLTNYALDEASHVTFDNRNSTRPNRAVIGDSSDAELLMTHDSVAASLDYLSTTFGRNSYDNAGAKVRSYGHYSRNYVNAFWDGSRLVFGDGDGVNASYLGVLDVTAHELGHAVTTNEANLIYQNESGALNEAASDMLAAMVEAYVDGGVSADTWDVGEDCWLASPALRYMDSPSDDGSSRDHYSARYTGTSDNGGVHWNSGIGNHWFYLLSVGGSHHTPAFRSGYTLSGIGISDAYAIWYGALNNYMTSSTNFAGVRVATESACTSMGYSSSVCQEVSLAWYEVGVGSDPGASTGGGGGGGTDTGTGGGTDTGTGGGTDTGSGGGTTVTCQSGWTQIDGNIASAGLKDDYTYTTSGRASHNFELYGPSGTDFDLYLYRANKRGNYSTVDSSTTSGSTESVSYSGKSGDYMVQVSAYAGSGDYTLCYQIQ